MSSRIVYEGPNNPTIFEEGARDRTRARIGEIPGHTPLERATSLLRDALLLPDATGSLVRLKSLAPHFAAEFFEPGVEPWVLAAEEVWSWVKEREARPEYTERQLRLIDRLIARHVADLPDELISIDGPIEYTLPGSDHPTLVAEISHYTRDMRAAWDVRLLMERKGWLSNDQLTWMGWGGRDGSSHPYGYGIWFERWDRDGKPHAKITHFEVVPDGSRDAALAVGLAALKALGIDVRAELAARR